MVGKRIWGSLGAVVLLVAWPLTAAEHGPAPYTPCADLSPGQESLCVAARTVEWTAWAAVLVVEYDWLTHAQATAHCVATNAATPLADLPARPVRAATGTTHCAGH